MPVRRSFAIERAAPRRRSVSLMAAVVAVSLGVSGCADVERGVGTTLEEFAASRAAADLATELGSVGFVASEYDAVSSRLHVQLVLTGDPVTERASWGKALDALLSSVTHRDLSGSIVAATVLSEDGGGLVFSPGALAADAAVPAVDEWLDVLAVAPIDFMVDVGGERDIQTEVSSVGLSGNELSLRLDRVASAAGVERRSAISTASDLAPLVTALRRLDKSNPDSWFLPGLMAFAGPATTNEQLDAVESILAAVDPATPLAVTYAQDVVDGLGIMTNSLGLMVVWYGHEPIDAREVRSLSAWSSLRTIVSAIPVSTSASVSLLAPGGGASFVLGACDGTVSDSTANEQALVDALRADLPLPAEAIAPGHCTLDL